MDKRLVALKLLLDELDIPSNISTVDDRKRVQKAVYLGQASGIGRSYRYGWYLMGPYSPPLTKDYYSLAEAIESGDNEYEEYELDEVVQERLRKIRPIMEVPEEVELTQENWLELLSSTHFLRRVRKLDEIEAREELGRLKPSLSDFADVADSKLKEVGLLT